MKLLTFTFTLLTLLTLSACMRDTTPTSQSKQSAEAQPKAPTESSAPAEIDPQILATRAFKEAPMLADRVASGELPPVSERLPENPKVIQPLHEIGKYGGTIRRLINDEAGRPGALKTLADGLLEFERPFGQEIIPNLASGYEFQDEGRTAIVHLRKGVKWSDGQPFTASDFLFWYEDLMLDLDASQNAVPDSKWLIDDKPIKVEMVDDTTLRFSAERPMGRLLNSLASELNSLLPRHYFAKFHPRYNPESTYEDLRREATGAGLIFNPDVPQLSAWYSVQWVKGLRVQYERNPYYWKVDTAGNQLPYADYMTFTFIPDRSVMLIKFINGEFDLFGRYAYPDLNDSLYSQRENGNYSIYMKEPDSGIAIYFNWSIKNPALRKAFRDKRVRVALSHAINREEINQVIFNGAFIPGGFSFTPSSPYYNETDFKRYSQYDPEKSARLLDEAGYRDSDGDGIRELEDGSPFEFVFDVGLQSYQMDVSELVVEQWKAIGVKAFLYPTKEEIHSNRRNTGEFEVNIWHFNGSIDPLNVQHYWTIVPPAQPMWYRTAMEEKPDWLVESTHLFEEAVATIDPEEVKKLMARVREIYAENMPGIGLGSLRSVWAASNNLGNVPAKGNFDHIYLGWARPVFHEQLYFKTLPSE